MCFTTTSEASDDDAHFNDDDDDARVLEEDGQDPDGGRNSSEMPSFTNYGFSADSDRSLYERWVDTSFSINKAF